MNTTADANHALTGLFVLAMLLAPLLHAQENPSPGPLGIVDEPCAPPPVMAPGVRTLLTELFMVPRTLVEADFGRLMGNTEFAEYNAANQSMGNRDWPGLCRFRADNARLLAATQSTRLVFMGDSITENWLLGDPALFNAETVNRGIGGQTSPQMLLRFRADVVALQPRIVHILAGTNDVAGNTGPTTMQDYKNTIMSMVELAQAHGIDVMLGSVPPASTFNWQPSLDPVPVIREMNIWLQQYAAQQGLRYVDYFSALAGAKGELRAELGNDGVHPNRDGYRIMRRLLEQELDAMQQE